MKRENFMNWDAFGNRSSQAVESRTISIKPTNFRSQITFIFHSFCQQNSNYWTIFFVKNSDVFDFFFSEISMLFDQINGLLSTNYFNSTSSYMQTCISHHLNELYVCSLWSLKLNLVSCFDAVIIFKIFFCSVYELTIQMFLQIIRQIRIKWIKIIKCI